MSLSNTSYTGNCILYAMETWLYISRQLTMIRTEIVKKYEYQGVSGTYIKTRLSYVSQMLAIQLRKWN